MLVGITFGNSENLNDLHAIDVNFQRNIADNLTLHDIILSEEICNARIMTSVSFAVLIQRIAG